jgi:cobalt-zinc-cadmium efflux system outer membrane protein
VGKIRATLIGGLGLAVAATAGAGTPSTSPPDVTVSGRLTESLSDAALRRLVVEVLERNPGLASSAAAARAARLEAPQASALPDPMVGATAFVSPPETRVGPQNVTGTFSQRLPWFGKLGLREQGALQRAAALEAQVEARRLELVTETRRLCYEVAFLDAWSKAVEDDHLTLEHYEELARTRYASGGGTEQAVVKIQAEITKDDARQLDIANRRAALVADLNALRDRPQDAALPAPALPAYPQVRADRGVLRERALAARPEMQRAALEVARAETGIDMARKEYKPDFTLGATYTFVGRRSDPAGLAAPPPDNGQDVFGVSVGINLPVHRGRLKAGVEQAAELRSAADEGKRSVVAAIDRSLGELTERVALTWQQLRLLRDVLAVQAEQSLRSAEAGYASGTSGSLDLLDAERVLLEVRTSIERTRADYAIAVARLEGAVGQPLDAEEGVSR